MSLDHPSDASAPPMLPPLPERYKVIRHLGSGAMGRVYEVMDQTRGEAVALKVVHTETAEDRRRVEREITTHGKLHHESIVRLYDVGASDNAVFFTMELLAGHTLADFANAPTPDLDEIRWLVSVTSKLLEALEHVHSKGFLHRDLKPSNVVIVAPDSESSVEDARIDEDPAVKLLDFGLARQRSAPTLSGSSPDGTPLYMSPEQLQVSVALDERSDLYSVGAILYHLLTRTPPYTRLPQVLTTIPPRDRFPKACPRRLVDLVYRLLAKERHLRPTSAKEACEEALAALDLDQRRRTITPRVLPPSFVGRAREIEKIGDALALSANGHGQFMRIGGHRGVGKTWLIQQSGVKGEAIVQLGMAPVGGTFVADGPWRHGLRELYSDLLSVLRTRHSDTELTQLLGPSMGQLLFVLGIDFEAKASAARSKPSKSPPTTPASINQDAILHFAIKLIRLAAEERRLFVVLEDVHNAGDLELELLARCAELVHDLPVFIAATYRTDALSERTREWLRKINSTGAPEPLLVEPLTDGEVRELLAAMLAPSIDLEPEFVASVIATSDGLPSKAVQTVQTWWSSGTLRVKDGSWQFEAQCALSRELSRLAVENLSADIFELLAAVSLLQSSHPEDVIAAILRDSSPTTAPGLVDGFELLPRLRDLVNKGLLRENDGGFELAPDVEETAVINKLAPEKLARLHVNAAEALLAHYNDTLENHLFRIATHFKAAGDDMRACEHFVAAARHADRIFANQKTREAYTRALSSANTPAQLYDIHVELGEFHTRIGEYSDALTCLEQAREQIKKLTESLNEDDLSLRRIDLLDKIGGVLQLQGDYSAALEKFSACRDAAGNRREVEARALWRIGGIRLDLGESDAARTFLEQS
ncbi:MAG: protein kinase, partial [Planctomycetes bacterium]|nr:protein kinase [Planctomycetota bacterium]